MGQYGRTPLATAGLLVNIDTFGIDQALCTAVHRRELIHL